MQPLCSNLATSLPSPSPLPLPLTVYPPSILNEKARQRFLLHRFFRRSVCQCFTLAQFPAKHPCSILAAFLQPPCSIQTIYILLSCYYLFSFSTAHCHHQERAHFMQNGKISANANYINTRHREFRNYRPHLFHQSTGPRVQWHPCCQPSADRS